MGIGFTIDTPIKVAQYGIDSVVSLSDDVLLEKMREMYCSKYKKHFEAITDKMEDYRAKRITSYLNLMNTLVSEQFENLQNLAQKSESQLRTYFNMLPKGATIQDEFKKLMENIPGPKEVQNWLAENISLGSIDVNIMTKLDRENYIGNEKLPTQFNDAHAALRGFALSNLASSVVFSAGMNPRLFSYAEQFNDFYPDENGTIKKQIILKVSDYRSALIQGKFLAKKGLWVSEYRIESGLNCGGHAFPTEGFLLGPILAEFKLKRKELLDTVYSVYAEALKQKKRLLPTTILPFKITTQGGVGTAEEHQFLIDHYQIDSVGWGSPFLLVPEATTVDTGTMEKLAAAKEKDLYLSNVSPLGVPFNNLRDSSKEMEKHLLINEGKPGSPCVRKYLAMNKEFTEKSLCTASRKYQSLKIKELKSADIADAEYKNQYAQIVQKECICTGLGTSALTVNHLDTKIEGKAVSVCPGPNMAYFSQIMRLNEIIDHIYGRTNHNSRPDRPNMFIKELNIYVDFLKDKVDTTSLISTRKQKQYLTTFAENLKHGINYYKRLFSDISQSFALTKSDLLRELDNSYCNLRMVQTSINDLSISKS